MKKITGLLSGAALVLTTAPALAANVDVYGQAHLAGYIMDDGGDYSALNIASNNSRLGFKAEHDIDMNLTVFTRLEGLVDYTTRDSGFNISSRDIYLGFRGHWGQVRVGHFDTPSKLLRNNTDMFGNQLGDARNLTRNNYGGNQGFDERFRNSVAYRTPVLNGFSAEFHYSAEHTSGDDDNDAPDSAADSNENDAYSTALTFEMGGLYAALAHERWNNEDPDEERNVTRAAAAYSTGPLRVSGFVQRATDPADWVYNVGGRYALTPMVSLKAQYTWLDADDSDFDANQIALGVDYQYAPELRFYANVAQLSNDEEQDRAPWLQASTLSVNGAEDETARAVSVGAVYSF